MHRAHIARQQPFDLFLRAEKRLFVYSIFLSILKFTEEL